MILSAFEFHLKVEVNHDSWAYEKQSDEQPIPQEGYHAWKQAFSHPYFFIPSVNIWLAPATWRLHCRCVYILRAPRAQKCQRKCMKRPRFSFQTQVNRFSNWFHNPRLQWMTPWWSWQHRTRSWYAAWPLVVHLDVFSFSLLYCDNSFLSRLAINNFIIIVIFRPISCHVRALPWWRWPHWPKPNQRWLNTSRSRFCLCTF